jgi:hypothetical protein
MRFAIPATPAKEVELHEWMRHEVLRIFKTQAAWADHLGISCSHVSGVLAGKKNPTPKMLDDLGLERVVIYRKKDHP